MEPNSGFDYTFRPARLLGHPRVVAPLIPGKISVSLQFIVPDLHIANIEIDKYKKLIMSCADEVYGSDIFNLENKETKAVATLVTIAFYVDCLQDNKDFHSFIENKSRIIIERFLGVVSYCAGIKMRAVNIVTTRNNGSSFETTLNAIEKAQFPRVGFSLPDEVYGEERLSDEVFTALFWLRRGLAEGDPIDTFNAFNGMSANSGSKLVEIT